jgi:hypothetical protein
LELTVAVDVPMMIGAGFKNAVDAFASGMSACVEVPAKLTTVPFSLAD